MVLALQEEHSEKLQLVDIYLQRLTERERRREAVISKGLMDVRRAQARASFKS